MIKNLMKDIRKMVIFVQVANKASFTAAANSLDLGKSVVSEHISQLEAELGVRLFNRSTRQISLTEAGQIFLLHCEQMLKQAQAAQESVQNLRLQPKGTLRVSTTLDYGINYLSNILPQFNLLYPDLNLELIYDNTLTDLVAEQIDLAIRIGKPKDSSLKYRLLSKTHMTLVASPQYLEQKGIPKQLADLMYHRWIGLNTFPSPINLTGHNLHIQKYGQQKIKESISLKAKYSTNSPTANYALVQQHMGIAMLPDFTVKQGLLDGDIIQVLPHYHFLEGDIFALYPYTRQLPTKTRLLLDFIANSYPN
ncbi:LysR family transcriptional regulator [Shewanella surugensis]|uniref:LysR family transcriptional regulator n=1 Tax=Shewanella surugensis TaxID=212020 RepID=A0ABT0LFW1_9GAMM|nr:LysR family transcriptional regulator [Shewanella surugensis]MCL1126586.1 LysR family transcriptional regulator [Shewanella surugensis]